MTVPTAKVLAVMLADPAGEHYGLQLMQQTGIASGTLYPILTRLQAAGWLGARWEDEDPSDAGRPVRRYYQLTAEGAERARVALADLHAQTAIAPGGAGSPGSDVQPAAPDAAVKPAAPGAAVRPAKQTRTRPAW
jgi:DNA-binding PadR family transcriptional regulator